MFNEGKCKGPCPAGRQHTCSNCLGSHRAYECPGKPKGAGKGKGKKSRGKGGKRSGAK